MMTELITKYIPSNLKNEGKEINWINLFIDAHNIYIIPNVVSFNLMFMIIRRKKCLPTISLVWLIEETCLEIQSELSFFKFMVEF